LSLEVIQNLPPALFIMGPTAAGKTDLAIEIAKHADVEIISVDSALVYKGMDIGTAKPDEQTLSHFPHHLVNILEPTEAYSAGSFKADALNLMADITARGKIPILVGGTMLYFKSLQYGIADLPAADPQVRKRLAELQDTHGLAYLHERLEKVDPVSAARIHVNDPQRLQRALEVYEITGKSLTELTEETASVDFPYRAIKIILSPFDRSILHQRIEKRYSTMMQNGFIEEMRALYSNPAYHADLPAIRAVGYRQAWAFLSGEYDEETFIYKAVVATRQMAKRQLTWLRSQPDGVWFDSGSGLPTQSVFNFLKDVLPELNL
jgi:tRNA dimethylallyltransferase